MAPQKPAIDTPRGVTIGAGGETDPLPDRRSRVMSGDRNTGTPDDKLRRRNGETPRDKPVEGEADKDVRDGGDTGKRERK